MQNKLKYGLIALALIITLILADQLSKWAIAEILFGQNYDPDLGTDKYPTPFWPWLISQGDRASFGAQAITPFFNLVMVWNEGISFGLFNDGNGGAPIALSILSAVITLAFTFWLYICDHKILYTGLVLVISGAIGNVIDRLRFGAVIDFLDIHAYGYHWPAFNLADSFICIGVGFLLVYSLYYDPSNKTDNKSHKD